MSSRNSLISSQSAVAPLALHLVQVGGDDLEQRHFEQVDLLLEHERQQEVERPLIDVEIEFEGSHGCLTVRSGRSRDDRYCGRSDAKQAVLAAPDDAADGPRSAGGPAR